MWVTQLGRCYRLVAAWWLMLVTLVLGRLKHSHFKYNILDGGIV